jgi:hypothetical protein
MKSINVVLLTLVALTFNFVFGSTIAAATGLPVAGVVLAIQAASFIPLPGGAMAGVLVEIWTGELIKKFRSDTSWLGKIKSRDELVNNDVIHLVDVGADPDVLINNTTYPIAVSQRTDGDISISLDKFDTTNTSVTDDELYAISYEKIASVVEQHVEVLQEKTAAKAAHALAPNTNSTNTPLVLSTGATNGNRKRASIGDVLTLKKNFDDLKVPKAGRVLVLCNAHIDDLLRTDEKFMQQYMNIREGQILKLHGFEIHEFVDTPVYKVVSTVLTKKAFGAAAEAEDQNASLAFYAPRAFKCSGSTDLYYRESKIDPEYRRNVVGFRQRFICLPKKNIGFGALVSAIA